MIRTARLGSIVANEHARLTGYTMSTRVLVDSHNNSPAPAWASLMLTSEAFSAGVNSFRAALYAISSGSSIWPSSGCKGTLFPLHAVSSCLSMRSLMNGICSIKNDPHGNFVMLTPQKDTLSFR